jgi:hypothetical protein
MEPHTSTTCLVTVKQLAAMPEYAWLTESALRHLIFDAEPRLNSAGDLVGGNGLDVAVVRLGRRVLIDIPAFDTWVMSHKSGL